MPFTLVELIKGLWLLPASYYEKNTKNAEGKASHYELGIQNDHLAKEKTAFFGLIPYNY